MSNLLGEGLLSPDNTAFARRLVTGVIENLQRIDAQITSFAPAWPISQMALVDRGILRIAIYELVIEASSPVGVVINEAVELAKAFGGESSPRFINGVLSSVSHLTSH
jgi:N utilization substance protein B